jgi:hypothetical protein
VTLAALVGIGPTSWIGAGAALWDTLILDNDFLEIVFPGIAKLDMDYEVEFKHPKNQGQDSTFVQDVGMKPRVVKATIKLWTDAHWQAWSTIVGALGIDQVGKPRSAYTLIHPQADTMGIGAVAIKKIHVPAPSSASEPMTIVIDFIEVLAPKPTVIVPAITTPNQLPGGGLLPGQGPGGAIVP